MTSKEIAEQNEKEFQINWNRWEQSNYKDSAAYKMMFSCVNFAAQNLIKAKISNCFIDVDSRALDLTCLVFERDFIAKHKRPQKLSSYLYLPMMGILYNHQLQHEEKASSYETIVSDSKEATKIKKDFYKSDYEKEDRIFAIYDRIYKETEQTLSEDEKLKERESVKVEKVISEEQIKNPDFIMELLGWGNN